MGEKSTDFVNIPEKSLERRLKVYFKAPTGKLNGGTSITSTPSKYLQILVKVSF